MTVFGLDVGTSSVKGLAIGERGEVLASAEDGYPFDTPRPGWAEQDPALWWRATERVLGALRAEAGEPPGIGLSGPTDVTDASGTLWFDVARRRWSARVLDALEVDPAWLPPALESPQAGGAGDQGAGAVGVGAVTPDVASVVLGTSGVVLVPTDAAQADARLQGSAHAVAGRWFSMGVILSAAGSLRWLRDVLDAPYDVLLAEAERCPPGADGLTFLPYLTGERAPHFDPQARGAFAGLTVRHGRGHLVRAVLEGVAYALRDVAAVVEGGDAATARVSGGGARGDLWLRIAASALRTPLQRVAVDEGAAYGAALLGGVRAGVWGGVDDAVGACVS